MKYDVDFVMEIVECCCRLHNVVHDDGAATRFRDDINLENLHIARVNESGVLADRAHWGGNEPI